MSDPATVKRGRGRPRKDGQPVQSRKPENPDCEPATKGYVKCIARKTLKHQHKKDSCYGITLLGALVGWFWLLGNAMVIPTRQLTETHFYILLAATTVLTLLSIDLVRAEDDCTFTPDTEFPVIQKYEPPTCEKKEECE